MRNIDEKDRNEFRKRLLEVTKEDIINVCKTYFIPQIEEGTTSRVVFGNVDEHHKDFEEGKWEFLNSLDFLSEGYFTNQEEEEN